MHDARPPLACRSQIGQRVSGAHALVASLPRAAALLAGLMRDTHDLLLAPLHPPTATEATGTA
jgi:hypothetical protein